MKTDSTKDRLDEIFDEQFKLKHKFGRIEHEKGLGIGLIKYIHFDLDNPRWQYVIKDHIFRVIEELVEAKASLMQVEQQEELADALHFMVELIILIGFRDPVSFFKLSIENHQDLLGAVWEKCDQVDFDDYPGELTEDWVFNPIYHLGVASNYLKNRPWKQSIRKTNASVFHHSLRLAFFGLIRAFKISGVADAQGVYDLYFHKNQVNHDRIDGGV